MPVIGPYSRVVEPNKFIEPISPELYMKGVLYRENLAENNLKSIVDTRNSLFNIPAEGPDKRKLSELDSELKQRISSMNLSNLSDLNTVSQIKGLLGEYTSNQDVLNIHKRVAMAEKEKKAIEDATRAGKVYNSDFLKKYNSYVSQNDFISNIPDLKYEIGYIAEDIGKIWKDAIQMTEPIETTVYDPATKQWIKTKEVSADRIRKNFDVLFSSNPNAQRTVRSSFDEKYEGFDWETEGLKKIDTDIFKMQQEIQYGKSMGLDTSPYEKKLLALEKMKSKPGLLAEGVKENYFKMELDDNLDAVSQINDYFSKGLPELSDLQKINIQTERAQALEKQKIANEYRKQEILSGIPMSAYTENGVLNLEGWLAASTKAIDDRKIRIASEIEEKKQEGRIALKELKIKAKSGENVKGVKIKEYEGESINSMTDALDKPAISKVMTIAEIIRNNPSIVGENSSEDIKLDKVTYEGGFYKYNNEIIDRKTLRSAIEKISQSDNLAPEGATGSSGSIGATGTQGWSTSDI